jgi:hypothetical protein
MLPLVEKITLGKLQEFGQVQAEVQELRRHHEYNN